MENETKRGVTWGWEIAEQIMQGFASWAIVLGFFLRTQKIQRIVV